MYTLKRTQIIPISIEEAWDFFSDPKNLSTITPDEMNFVIKTEVPEKVHSGLIIKYKVSPLMNIPTTWVTEIKNVEAPHFFVDEQRFGPYAMWHHQHHFKEVEGGVEIMDEVNYKLPFGFLGKIMGGFVWKKVNSIFDYRQKKLEELFKQ